MTVKIYATVLFSACFITLFSMDAIGQDTTRKSYNFFKPMPKSLEREEMETDRPNVTETPHTVDAGHIQYEADIFKHQRQTTDDIKQRRWLYNQANVKLGLLRNTSLHVIIQSFGKELNADASPKSTQTASGFGDITLRLKQCLFGNYNGNFSIALMPYVKFPTNKFSDNNKYEEGLLVPMLLKLPKDWKIGMQVEGDYLKDDDGQARHTELLHSLVISHVLFDKLEVFGETFYTYNFKEHHF